MSKDIVIEKIREIAVRLAKENELELVQAQVVGSSKNLTIRIFIDKPGGVTHEDCSLISRQMGKTLDAQDLFPLSYILEVSSPGLERELYSLQDFKRFVGSLAKVKTSAAIDGQKNFRGRIVGIEGEQIVFDNKTNGTMRFNFDVIAKANLEIDIEEELKKRKTENKK